MAEGGITGSDCKREQSLISKKARQRASKHCDGIKASFIFFCIPYYLVHAFARNFEWVHNTMALSATLRLIKRKQIDGAPGNKIPWVDSRRDNVGEEALKIKVWVLSYASSWCPDDSFPMWKMEATHLLPVSSSLPPTMKPSFSYNCSSPIMEIMGKK